ncbi:hypothetical protein AKJ38_01965 [candidate division MSBL1 archaeon SCGC-AAA259I14]|uniref:Uncharacterized protein n=1 Tax=candidate division MSBL1 archaeon SCGC-AAA259I14 TaxID=1698268 RepID=A0A133US75_9EURY|nr:hypothetical protein AKJ38_01965 [candidate division MSBL1 archaeon SCGC-AAA259I14]
MPNSSNQEEENRLKMLDRDGKMFKVLGEDITSVNPYNGCGYNCYDGGCWAKNFAENHPEWAGYGDGFEPSFVEKRIDSSNTRGKIRNNDYIWLGIMGDFAFQSTEVMERIINEVVRPYEENMFLLATKNPDSFNRLIDDLPENVMVSTTIETNRGYDYGEEYNVSELLRAKALRVSWRTGL